MFRCQGFHVFCATPICAGPIIGPWYASRVTTVGVKDSLASGAFFILFPTLWLSFRGSLVFLDVSGTFLAMISRALLSCPRSLEYEALFFPSVAFGPSMFFSRCFMFSHVPPPYAADGLPLNADWSSTQEQAFGPLPSPVPVTRPDFEMVFSQHSPRNGYRLGPLSQGLSISLEVFSPTAIAGRFPLVFAPTFFVMSWLVSMGIFFSFFFSYPPRFPPVKGTTSVFSPPRRPSWMRSRASPRGPPLPFRPLFNPASCNAVFDFTRETP